MAQEYTDYQVAVDPTYSTHDFMQPIKDNIDQLVFNTENDTEDLQSLANETQ